MNGCSTHSGPLVVIPVVAGIGNALLAVPMVRQLKRHRPDHRLHIVARLEAMAEVFRRLPEVDQVQVVGNGSWRWLRAMRRLRRQHPALCIVPFPSNRWQYTAVAVASGAQRRLIHSYPVGRLRTLRFLPVELLPAVRGIHDVQQNLRLLGPLGIQTDGDEAPVFVLSDHDRQRAGDLLSSVGLADSRPIAVHAGSARTVLARAKRWPSVSYGRLVDELRRTFSQPVLILEGPDEAGVADEILRHSTGAAAAVLRLRGGLGDAAAVLQRCTLYVGSDSGLAHLAAAVGTPPVTLFAPADPDRVCPFGYRDLVVQPPNRDCAPCFAYPWRSTYPRLQCHDPLCIAEITVESVMAAVQTALQRRPAQLAQGNRAG